MNFLINTQVLAFAPWEAIKGFFANMIEWLFELTMAVGLPSYVLAIFLLTLIIRVVTQPLQNKQLRATRRMQMLAPEIEAIKKRYANDPQKQQKLTMALYKEHGASPLSGCLPLLIQMPILIALFTALRQFGVDADAVHPLYPEYFSFWVWDNLSTAVNQGPYKLLLPLVAALSTLLQQLVTVSNLQDRQQRMMLIIMPLMFMFIVQNFPVLLSFYWIFYSLIGAAISYPILQRWKKIDQAEIDAKRAAKEAEEEERKAKREAARKKGKKQPQKPGYAVKAGDAMVADASGDEGEADDGEEEPDLSYLDELDENERKEALVEIELEEKFREYLREREFTVKTKRIKLRPYDKEAQEVEIAYDARGQEMEVSELRKRFVQQTTAPRGMPNMSLGEVFGFGRAKKKGKQDQE